MDGNDSWLLIIVVGVAFFIGYGIVSFVYNRIPHRERADFDNREHELSGQTGNPLGEEERHARVLGLGYNYTLSEITDAYRRQLSKYHPDKVDHLGDEFKAIAEERTRQIIASYEYFCKKYNIR